MSRRQLVCYHAVVRFLERHDGLDISVARMACGGAPADDRAILDYLAAHAGLDIASVRRRILTPVVRTALAMGAAGVRMGHVRLVIVNGTVVTVRLTTWDRIEPRDKPRGRPPDHARAGAATGRGMVMRTSHPTRASVATHCAVPREAVRSVLTAGLIAARSGRRMARSADRAQRFGERGCPQFLSVHLTTGHQSPVRSQ